MRHNFPASILCVTLVSNCFAQSAPPTASEIEASLSSGMAQRVLQYELLLGSELDASIAVCVDEELKNTWMVPAKPEVELSAKAIERVRRRLEICQAVSGTHSQQKRLSAEIRRTMELQLIAARALEVPKSLAQSCIAKSQSKDDFKTCLTRAKEMNPSDNEWFKWSTLYDRRAYFAAIWPGGD